MNKKYLLVENAIKKNQPVQEFGAIELALGVAALKLIWFAILVFVYSNKQVSEAKLDSKLTKRLKSIVPSKLWDWKVMVLHKETNAMNAFTWGGKHLYITKGLYDILTEDEIIAVMLHEAGHSMRFHGAGRELVSTIGLASIIGIAYKVWDETGHPMAVASLFAYKLYQAFVTPAFSRMNEWTADSYAVKYGYAKHLASGLTKLAKSYNMNLKSCSSFMCKISREMEHLTHSHPDIRKRIEKAANSAEGKKALKEKNPKVALLKFSKVLGITEKDVDKVDAEKGGSPVLSKLKNLFSSDTKKVLQ